LVKAGTEHGRISGVLEVKSGTNFQPLSKPLWLSTIYSHIPKCPMETDIVHVEKDIVCVWDIRRVEDHLEDGL
jgi:hypothetical protein